MKKDKKLKKPNFYTIDKLIKMGADYNVIIGERSNGKTHTVLDIFLFGYHKDGINVNGYLDDGTQSAIIRRYDEDFKNRYGAEMFTGFISNTYDGNILAKHTNGEWNDIEYYNKRWYLKLVDEDGKTIKKDDNPFCYGFSLSSEEHYKSTSYPKIKLILFDEFITRGLYFPNEFIIFTSILSTIIRVRDDVKIFMCGNTINKYNPYFKEMGLTNAKNQEMGTIDLYTYGESDLKVAVEFCGNKDFQKSKASNKYFAFNNPKLKMVTNGVWELDIYPHLPIKYNPNDILYMYFIIFEGDILQCEIINADNVVFTYIHRKTTPIKDDKYLVYQQSYSHKLNYRRKLTKPTSDLEKRITTFYNSDKVFYQDNEVGEIMRNYINWCVGADE